MVGTQSRSMERMLVPRDSFSTIPRMRARAKKACFGAGLLNDKIVNHIMHEIRTLMRLMKIVMRRTRRRDGLLSTQRPRALANRSTQTVSAMPLQWEVNFKNLQFYHAGEL